MTSLAKIVEQHGKNTRLPGYAKTFVTTKSDDDMKGQVREFRDLNPTVKFTDEEDQLLNDIASGKVEFDYSEAPMADDPNQEYMTAGDLQNPGKAIPPVQPGELRLDETAGGVAYDEDNHPDRVAMVEKANEMKEEDVADRDPEAADAPLTNKENIPGDENQDGVLDEKQQYPESIK